MINIKNFFHSGSRMLITIGAIGGGILFLIYIFGFFPKLWEIALPHLLEASVGILFLWILIWTILLIKYRFAKYSPDTTRKDMSGETLKEIKEVEKVLNQKIKEIEGKINKIIDIGNDFKNLSRDFLHLKLHIPFRKVDTNDFIKALNIDIQEKTEWRIDEDLEDIQKYIEKNGIYSGYIADLTKALNSLPEEYKIQKETILKIMSEKRY